MCWKKVESLGVEKLLKTSRKSGSVHSIFISAVSPLSFLRLYSELVSEFVGPLGLYNVNR